MPDYSSISEITPTFPTLTTEEEIDLLARPHCGWAWLGAFEFPDGVHLLHNGVGTVSVAGYDWKGVSDPVSGRLVNVSAVEEPAFGQAASITVVLSGASRDFVRSVLQTARDIEALPVDLYFAIFDGETQECLMGRKMFPGRMSAPSCHWKGLSVRFVSLTIESIWSTMRFPLGRKWSNAGQQAEYPGDLGFSLVGVPAEEQWT